MKVFYLNMICRMKQHIVKHVPLLDLFFLAHRLLLMKCSGKYSDMLEKALFNGMLSGSSLDGKRFFYANPLASYKNSNTHRPNANSTVEYYQRSEWFNCACCPPNYARLMASLGEYIYTYNDNELAIHLYIGSKAELQIKETNVTINQNTMYPFEDTIYIKLNTKKPVEFYLKLRIPGWCDKYELYINGQNQNENDALENGYLCLRRLWNSGDELLLKLNMPVLKVYSHPDIRFNTGCTALQRGPLVYCIEQADHDVPVHRIAMSDTSEFYTEYKSGLLNGITEKQGK
jgi:uncharacterized protein